MDSATTSRLRNRSLKQTKNNLPHGVDSSYLESQHYESTRQVYRYLDATGVGKFTPLFIDSVWNSVNDTIHHLEPLPEEAFKELMGMIEGLTKVRNELRHARFLFDLEEIHPVHRLVIRNRAVLRGKDILYKVILAWPRR
jgi:hypothetical protein